MPGDQAPKSPDANWEHRVETLEARMKHLDAELEGLQDALYRQAVLHGEHFGDFAPAHTARAAGA